MSSMSLRSLNLPGVGTKYEFQTDKGDTVAIFFTKTGTIQMYTLQKGCNTPSAAEMTPVEARRLGNILLNAIRIRSNRGGKTLRVHHVFRGRPRSRKCRA